MYPKQSKTVHVETLHDELCLYDWQRKEVHALNPTVAQVWQLCDGETSAAQMAGALRANLLTDLDATQAQAVVEASLAQLYDAHLLEGKAAKMGGLRPVSRRDMLKWGLSAMLVPVITSILAPSPVAAQSPVNTPPTAVNDSLSGAPNSTISGNLMTNDTLGTPAATLTSFGGGDLGGTVTTNAAGASVALAGGTLTVGADGAVSLVNPTTPGTYTFQYRLTNSAGTSDATVTIEVTSTSGTCRNYDIVLVADMSGSVDATELQDTKNGILDFINNVGLGGTTQVGLASYGSLSTLDHPLTQDIGSLTTAVNALTQAGSTNIYAGINEGAAELTSARHNPANGQILIVMTDGWQNVSPPDGGNPVDAATAAKGAGIRVIALAITGDADTATMQQVASVPGDYYYSDTFVDLGQILNSINCTAT